LVALFFVQKNFDDSIKKRTWAWVNEVNFVTTNFSMMIVLRKGRGLRMFATDCRVYLTLYIITG
jgi:hypothetical protein